MAITYKTVISKAITGFNDIQQKIYDNSEQLSAPNPTDANSIKSITEITSALGPAKFSTTNTNTLGLSYSSKEPGSGETYVLATGKYAIVDSSETGGKYYYLKTSLSGTGSASTSINFTKAGLVKKDTGITTQNIVPQSAITKYLRLPKASFSSPFSIGTSKNSASTITTRTPESGKEGNYYKLVITPTISGSLSAGYTTGYSSLNPSTSEGTYYVNRSVISTNTIDGGTFKTSIDTENSTISFLSSKPSTGTDGTHYFSVVSTGSGDSNTASSSFSISEGYNDATIIGGTSGTPMLATNGGKTTKYVKASGLTHSSGTFTTSIDTSKSTISFLSSKPSTGTDGTDYFSVYPTGSGDSDTSSSSVSEGYTKGLSKFGTPSNNGNTERYIQKASISTNTIDGGTFKTSIDTSKSTISFLSSKPSTGTDGTDYFSVISNGSGTSGSASSSFLISPGYIGSTGLSGGTSGTPSNNGNTRSYIKKSVLSQSTSGTASFRTSLSSASPNFSYSGTKPTTGTDGTDYFTISSSSNSINSATVKASATEGYTKEISSTSSNAPATKITPENSGNSSIYIPRATFQYVEDDTTGDFRFVSVSTPGYIPAGVIMPNSIAGVMDIANVSMALSTLNSEDDTEPIKKTTGNIPVGAYQIDSTITVLDTGYVKDKDSIHFDKNSSGALYNYYINKSTLKVSDLTGGDKITLDLIKPDKTTSNSNISNYTDVGISDTIPTTGYYFPVYAASKSSTVNFGGVTITEGYTAGVTSTGSGSKTVSTNARTEYVTIKAGSVSGGGLTGNGDVGIDIYEVSSSNDSNITLAQVDIAGSKDTTNYPYYFQVGAKGTTKTITRANITTTSGYVPAGTAISSASANVTAAEVKEYVRMKKGTISGGGLTGAADVGIDIYEVSSSNDSNITLGQVDIAAAKDTTNYPYYFQVGAKGTTKSITRAAITNTEGYVKAGDLAISSGSASITANEVKEYVRMKKGTISGGGLTGAADVGIDIYEIASASQDTNINISQVDVGDKDATNYPYYFKVGAKGTTKSITRAAITNTEGYVKANDLAISSGSASITANEKTEYIKLKQGTVSGGGLTGAGNIALDIYELASDVQDANVTLSDVDVGNKDTTNYPYYFKVGANGTSNLTITRAAVTTGTEGYIKSGNSLLGSTTATVGTTEKSEYVKIKAGSCTVAGGGLTAGSSTISTSGMTLSTTNTSGISVSAYGTVTRAAITDKHTSGYIPTKAATTVIASTSLNSTTATKYLTDLAVPASKTLNSVSNAGTITTLNGTGTITTQSGTQTITTNSGTITVGTNSKTVNITTNNSTVNISNNTSAVNISASTGYVQYVDWKIYRNSTNKTLEFIFS